MENVCDLKIYAIDQDQIAADHNVRVIRRRRREHHFEFPRAGLHFLLKARRQSSTNHQLALQSGRKTIAFGQAGWEMGVVSAIPVVDVAIMIGINLVAVTLVVAFAMTIAVVVVIAIVFVVAVTLSYGDSG
jgi:hypothetical protein